VQLSNITFYDFAVFDPWLFTQWINYSFFSPLGKVAGRAIYFTDVFSLFFFIFLVVAPGATLAQKPMVRSSPKFQDW